MFLDFFFLQYWVSNVCSHFFLTMGLFKVFLPFKWKKCWTKRDKRECSWVIKWPPPFLLKYRLVIDRSFSAWMINRSFRALRYMKTCLTQFLNSGKNVKVKAFRFFSSFFAVSWYCHCLLLHMPPFTFERCFMVWVWVY